jgi:hypothetical protein
MGPRLKYVRGGFTLGASLGLAFVEVAHGELRRFAGSGSAGHGERDDQGGKWER